MTSPNTQPIYTRDIFIWNARLTTQVTPRTLITASTPQFLNSVGTNGGVLWSIRAIPLGNNTASTLRVYGRGAEATSVLDYRLFFEVTLPHIEEAHDTVSLPVIEVPLPRIYTRDSIESRGVVCPPSYGFAVSLGVAVQDGWDVIVTGGSY